MAYLAFTMGVFAGLALGFIGTIFVIRVAVNRMNQTSNTVHPTASSHPTSDTTMA